MLNNLKLEAPGKKWAASDQFCDESKNLIDNYIVLGPWVCGNGEHRVAFAKDISNLYQCIAAGKLAQQVRRNL